MATIAPALTFGALFRDPTANPLGTTETDLCAAYRVIYAHYHVEDYPLTVEELEQEILTDFLEPIGAVGIMVADSESKLANSSSPMDMLDTQVVGLVKPTLTGVLPSALKGKWMAPMPPRWLLTGISWA
jgi:hypothetical protein